MRCTSPLSDVLDQLEHSAHGNSIAVQDVIEHLGHRSYASPTLIFSPVHLARQGDTCHHGAHRDDCFHPGGANDCGRERVWLLGFITRRHIARQKSDQHFTVRQK